MTVADTLNNAWSYVAGQCTAFVASVLSWVPAGWGNAAQWWTNAQQQGYATGQTPQVGAVAVWSGALPGSGGYGHVAEVTGVSGSSFTVQEENYTGGPGVQDTRTVPDNSPDLLGFIYGPPGTAAPTGTTAQLTSATSSTSGGGSIPVVSGVQQDIQQGVQNAINATLDNWVQTALGGISTGASNAGQDVASFVNNNLIAFAVAGAVTTVVMWRMKADS